MAKKKTIKVPKNITYAESNASWCRVSPTSQTGDGTLTVEVDENPSETDDRTAIITLVGEGVDNVVINLTQKKHSDEPQVEEFWYSDNYIVDIAVDDYVVHNYNMGQHTYGTAMGWENQDKPKRQYLAEVAVIPAFGDAYVYGTHYAKFD